MFAAALSKDWPGLLGLTQLQTSVWPLQSFCNNYSNHTWSALCCATPLLQVRKDSGARVCVCSFAYAH